MYWCIFVNFEFGSKALGPPTYNYWLKLNLVILLANTQIYIVVLNHHTECEQGFIIIAEQDI